MTSSRLPAVFLGHGNPMNALDDNPWTQAWRALAAGIPRPRAVVAVSAHWYVPGTRVTANERPETIHDFGGFPPELFAMQYPAPGDPALAAEVAGLLGPTARTDTTWGLDHGAWSLLVHLYPDADVPVVQVSLDVALPAVKHLELARALSPLRDEGVLVLGSGNIVHNLRAYDWSGTSHGKAHDWAARFDAQVRGLAAAGDLPALADYTSLGRDALLSVPTPEHYLPLLWILAMQRQDEAVGFPVAGFDGGSIGMTGVQVG
jgi:4,5-DOPA dioxygenase extradiol